MVSLSENASAISYVLITFWVGSPSYHVRVIFSWVSKLIWDWFGFVSLRDVIGPKNSRHPFNQSYSDLNRSQLLHSRFPACEAISFVLLSVVIDLFRVHPLPLPHKVPWKLASTQSHSQEGRGNVRRELTPWLKWRNTVAHASSPIRLSIPELEYSLYARAVSSPSSNANFKYPSPQLTSSLSQFRLLSVATSLLFRVTRKPSTRGSSEYPGASAAST